MSYYFELTKLLIQSLSNSFKDNWDFIRFPQGSATRYSLRAWIKSIILRLGFIRKNDLLDIFSSFEKVAPRYQFLFENLANKESKDLLLRVILYRFLGHRKIKLPLSIDSYWKEYNQINRLANKVDFIDPNFLDFKLFRFDLADLGYNLKLYFTPMGVYSDFVIKQYELHHQNRVIKPAAGQVIIDGGGCWGDTALYFAHEVGDKGKVYSFEFIPSNLAIFQRNLDLNPLFSSIVEVIPNPLWDVSDTTMFIKDNGPASQIRENPFNENTGTINTITIDDFVSQIKNDRLHWIKLDIEGAELNALKGAIKSIQRFKPILAIALYHSDDDFGQIPAFIDSLKLGYRFYLSHATIHQEETILFAQTNDN